MTDAAKIHVAVLASGSGTNAQNLIQYFRRHDNISISLVISNNPGAYVLRRAEQEKVPYEVITKEQWTRENEVSKILNSYNIDFIILAGYLLLLPSWLVHNYPGKIINIHPALLPSYGGKGMYGEKVHRAVIESKETTSGITIHYVNEEYDQGDIILQAKCPVLHDDTHDTLAARIHQLEYEYYPKIAEKVILRKSFVANQ